MFQESWVTGKVPTRLFVELITPFEIALQDLGHVLVQVRAICSRSSRILACPRILAEHGSWQTEWNSGHPARARRCQRGLFVDLRQLQRVDQRLLAPRVRGDAPAAYVCIYPYGVNVCIYSMYVCIYP